MPKCLENMSIEQNVRVRKGLLRPVTTTCWGMEYSIHGTFCVLLMWRCRHGDSLNRDIEIIWMHQMGCGGSAILLGSCCRWGTTQYLGIEVFLLLLLFWCENIPFLITNIIYAACPLTHREEVSSIFPNVNVTGKRTLPTSRGSFFILLLCVQWDNLFHSCTMR